MKALITGGGTGGHIYPALAIAGELKKRGWDILYLGSQDRMEAEIVPEAGYQYRGLTLKALPRKLSLNLVKSLFLNFYAFLKALKIVAQSKADIVIGTGGFAAGPVVLAGVLLRKKTIIHEQNAYPGLTNKILSILVDKICLNFTGAAKYLKVSADKIVATGNPVRPEITKISYQKSCQILNLNPDYKTILVTGGSLGAEIINQNLTKLYQYVLAEDKLQIIHLTGKKNYQKVLEFLIEQDIELDSEKIHVIAYLKEMGAALTAADLIISRAGATALAEITISALPAILIPFAAAAENHQLYNAAALEKLGAALVIEEADLTAELLAEQAKKILNSPEKAALMSEASAALAQRDSLAKIIKLIEKESAGD